MERYFHLYSDGKTVKEIDWATFRKYGLANWDAKGKKRLCMLLKNEIYFSRGRSGVCVRMEQLNQILEKEAST